MKQAVNRFINKHQLLHGGATVIVGVSGGPDSLALLHFLWKEYKEWLSLRLVVAHANHQLREEESKKDFLFVRSFCEEKGICFEGKHLDVKRYKERNEVSTQMAARACRYEFFKEVMEKHRGDYLALGHHGDDQVETMLMNQVRGSFGYGLSGIPAKRKFAGGWIIRPFLAVTKTEIEMYCDEERLSPRIDETNLTTDYVRNRFRHVVLPFLKEENPNVHRQFQHLSERNSDDEAFLEERAKLEMKDVIIRKEKCEIKIVVTAFRKLAIPLQRRGIQLILSYLYEERSFITSIHIEQIRTLLHSNEPSSQLHLPKKLMVERSYDTCTFSFSTAKKEKEMIEPQLLQVPGMVETKIGKIKAETVLTYPKDKENKFCYISDAEKMSPPFIVRTVKSGDTIKMAGGTKKVSRLFIDKKIARDKRKSWPIVVNENGEVVWVPLLAHSKKSAVTKMSQIYLVLTVELADDFLL